VRWQNRSFGRFTSAQPAGDGALWGSLQTSPGANPRLRRLSRPGTTVSATDSDSTGFSELSFKKGQSVYAYMVFDKRYFPGTRVPVWGSVAPEGSTKVSPTEVHQLRHYRDWPRWPGGTERIV